MDEKIGNFIIEMIRSITYLAPALVIFYRQGKRDQLFDQSIKDLNSLGSKVNVIERTQEEGLADVKEKISSIEIAITKISTAMDFISKQIEELKAK